MALDNGRMSDSYINFLERESRGYADKRPVRWIIRRAVAG